MRHRFFSRALFQLTWCSSCLLIMSCGGGSSGGSGHAFGVPPTPGSGGGSDTMLSLGTPVLDLSNVENGTVRIRFPNAQGDQPFPTAMAVSPVSGSTAVSAIADFPNPSDASYQIASDGLVVYFPRATAYQLILTVEDAGDQSQQSAPIVVQVPTTNVFSMSGDVADGISGSESGVQTNLRLRWNPLGVPNQNIATVVSQVTSGNFSFNNLVGSVTDFNVRVDATTP